MTSIRATFAAAVAAASLPVAAGEASDLWWNPAESGWGANVVQQGDVAFVTLFVHDREGRPTWYSADARVFALGDDNRPAFRGTLYRTTGPWHGGPFDPAQVATVPTGHVVLEPRAGGALFLEYSADGVQASKNLVRLTFAIPDLGGLYHGSFRLRESVPGGQAGTVRRYSADLTLGIEGGTATLDVSGEAGRCEYRGAWQASGKFLRMAGRYACEGGEEGEFEIAELEAARHGISGRLSTSAEGVHRAGRFAAARF